MKYHKFVIHVLYTSEMNSTEPQFLKNWRLISTKNLSYKLVENIELLHMKQLYNMTREIIFNANQCLIFHIIQPFQLVRFLLHNYLSHLVVDHDL